MSDLLKFHFDGNDRLRRLVGDDDLEKRIVDRQMRKGQAAVTGEAPCVTKNLDVEDGEPQLEKRHLEKRRLENPYSDWMRKPNVTQEESG